MRPTWCALCGFSVNEHDSVALAKLSEQSDAPKPKLLATDRAVFMATVDPDNIALLCHWKCLEMTKQPHRNRLLKSLAFVFEPSAAQQKMRLEFYQRHGASLIRSLLGMTFPPEISLMIATHLPRPVLSCLAVLHGMEAHCLATSVTSGGRELTYEGRKYIPNSANLRAGRLDMVAKSWSPSCRKDPIHFGLDHLGIQAVMSGEWTGEDPVGPPNQELWWKTVYRWERAFHTFKFSNDDYKLRNLRVVPQPDGDFEDDFWWEMPHGQPKRLRLEDFGPRHSEPRRMKAVKLTTARGVSFHWDCSLVCISAHASDTDSMPYNRMPSTRTRGIDVYVPLEENERIHEVWRHEVQGRTSPSLVFVTSLGRVIGAGLVPWPGPARHTYKLLDETCSGFHYDLNNIGISILGFESPAPSAPSSARIPACPRPLSPYPPTDRMQHYLHTFAEVSDVVSVCPCHMSTNGRDSVTGLFLTHGDGRRSCVGRVRLDCLGAVLEVGNAQGMTLRMSESEKGRRFVEAIELSDEVIEQGDTRSVHVRWTGRLEWWISGRECVVSYHEDPLDQG